MTGAAAQRQLSSEPPVLSIRSSIRSSSSSSSSLVQLVGLAVGVVQPQLGVQVVQLAVAAEQEGTHLQQKNIRQQGRSACWVLPAPLPS